MPTQQLVGVGGHVLALRPVELVVEEEVERFQFQGEAEIFGSRRRPAPGRQIRELP
ncbi:hypothetical protein [Streptomyces sp. 3N207]|uniref:hypothetical protein n=1 Tax=Streptomyces sp. 3N207 TaxID=3457417 RepID=UPI003FD6910D